MGVYINMEMPKSCTVCPFENFGDCYGGKVKAIMDIDDYVSAGKRHPRCPLAPVPPHGRLIDADGLMDKVIAKYLKHERMGQLVFAAAEIKQDICDLISNAPTIIPAEEGNT